MRMCVPVLVSLVTTTTLFTESAFARRQFDSNSGRFLQRDPIEQPSKNAYEYVLSNPINDRDPSGAFPQTESEVRSNRNYCKDRGNLLHPNHNCYREINPGGSANHLCFRRDCGCYDAGESHRDCVGPASGRGPFGGCLYFNPCLVLLHNFHDLFPGVPGCPITDPV